MLQGLAGYILEQPSALVPPGMVRVCGCLVLVNGTLGELPVKAAVHGMPELDGAHRERLRFQPVKRLTPVTTPQRGPVAPPAVHPLRPVRSGRACRITSPPECGLVRPELAEALEIVFEQFAGERGFTAEGPLEIGLLRGFKAGSPGHGEGRAADITTVGGKSLLAWKRQWDRALAAAEKLSDLQQRAEAISAEQKRNLGYGLYKALQAHGGWRVNKGGWRPYRGVEQLFGPWTATEGPWKTIWIENPNPYQKQRLADQQWVFQAHHDHIHVAR
jgi:hypothetical protein